MNQHIIRAMNDIDWWHRINLGEGVVTPGKAQHTVEHASIYFGMPEDLRGKTVLDIGCSDGMFSFEAERRGGDVLAIDTSKPDDLCFGKAQDWPRGFNFAKRALGSKVAFQDLDFFEIDPGLQWDVVLFYGVLYHLRRPIEALEKLEQITKPGGICLIETTYSISPNGAPSWEYRPGHHGDQTNRWYPSLSGLLAALKHHGFREAKMVGHWQALERMTVLATK
jgi:tRNA (mo5U34)-methyltransferase